MMPVYDGPATPPSPPTEPERVYHLELRHFPRNLCRFNLSGEELRATVLEPWAADRLFELGELKWDPRQARLTVLEGPRIPPTQLSMGRGWRTAQHQSKDVTAQLLATATGETDRPDRDTRAVDPMADSLGLELLAQMRDEPTPLRRVWELASARDPSAPASETLAIAERALLSLLRARLIVLLRAATPEATPEAMGEQDTLPALRALESWTGSRVWIRRI